MGILTTKNIILLNHSCSVMTSQLLEWIEQCTFYDLLFCCQHHPTFCLYSQHTTPARQNYHDLQKFNVHLGTQRSMRFQRITIVIGACFFAMTFDGSSRCRIELILIILSQTSSSCVRSFPYKVQAPGGLFFSRSFLGPGVHFLYGATDCARHG